MVNLNHLCTLVQTAMERNTSAKAAVEIALYDLWAQLHGAPLYQMLGGGDPAVLAGTERRYRTRAPARIAAGLGERPALRPRRGTYLNEQPQVEFQLEYTDRDGRVQQVSVRRFIPLIDLANIPRETVTLLYDPDDRGNVRLEGV